MPVRKNPVLNPRRLGIPVGYPTNSALPCSETILAVLMLSNVLSRSIGVMIQEKFAS